MRCVAQVADHLIDVVFERRRPLRRLDRDGAREVTGCNRGCNFGDGADLRGQRRRSRFTLSVRSRQVPAAPGTLAWPPSFPSMPTSRCDRCHLVAKVARRVDHGVEWYRRAPRSPLSPPEPLLLQFPLATRSQPGNAAHLAGEVLRHRVNVSVRSFQVPPRREHRPARQLSIGCPPRGRRGYSEARSKLVTICLMVS